VSSDLAIADLTTADFVTDSPYTEMSASGSWTKSFVKPPLPWRSKVIGPLAGIMLAFAAAPATAMPDFWFLDRKRRDSATATWILESLIGTPITRFEALRIAHQIMERAEQRRLKVADWEAQRSMYWEEGP
jgi:hypothetical protein